MRACAALLTEQQQQQQQQPPCMQGLGVSACLSAAVLLLFYAVWTTDSCQAGWLVSYLIGLGIYNSHGLRGCGIGSD
jgi:hypothetical protein